MPRIPHPKKPVSAKSAAGAALAAAMAAFHSDLNEPIRPTFCTPIRPTEPPLAAESDHSLRTARCVSDRISRDSLVDVVFYGGAQLTIKQQSRQQISRIPDKAPESDDDRSSVSDEKDCSEALGKGNRDTEVDLRRLRQRQKCSSDRRCDRRHRQCYHDGNDSGAPERERSDGDTSELIGLLFGRVYGSERQMVSRQGKVQESISTCDSINGNGSSGACGGGEGDFDARGYAATSGDMSELMTLTCGNLDETLMTQMKALYDARSGIEAAASTVTASEQNIRPTKRQDCNRSFNNCSVKDEEAADAAVATMLASTIAVAPKAPSTSATAAASVAASKAASAGSAAASGVAASKAASAGSAALAASKPEALSTSGTVVASTVAAAASTVHEEAIPPSERISKPPGGNFELCTCDIHGPDDVSKSSDIIVESKVVIDLGNFNKNCASDASSCQVCTCHDEYRPTAASNRRGSRHGRLRTPDICKRLLTSYIHGASCGKSSSTAAATETAAQVEWRESRRVVKSPLELKLNIESSGEEFEVLNSEEKNEIAETAETATTSRGTSQSRRTGRGRKQRPTKRKEEETAPKNKAANESGKREKRQPRRERQDRLGEEEQRQGREERSEKQRRQGNGRRDDGDLVAEKDRLKKGEKQQRRPPGKQNRDE